MSFTCSIISSADYNINGAILYEYTADHDVRRATVATNHIMFCDWQEQQQPGT